MTPDTTTSRIDARSTTGSLARFRNLLRTMDESLDSARRRRLGLDALLVPQAQASTGPVRAKATKIVRGA